MAEQDTSVSRPRLFYNNGAAQDQSPLFQLPGELRDDIYNLALAAFEDKDHPYEASTYWARPRHSAPRRSDLALLRTCKAIHRETWFKPFSLADHSFWLTSYDRAPRNAVTFDRFSEALAAAHEQQGDVDIEHIRFFAQMYALQEYSRLQAYLDLPHLRPRDITITIRHTDWYWWETDEWLRLSPQVARFNEFPVSTRRISLELETLERKKDQLESIVAQLKQTWYFTKTNGNRLTAKNTNVDVESWRGSSTLGNARWLRDESEPGYINYYVATVRFEHEPESGAADMSDPAELMVVNRPSKKRGDMTSIDIGLLHNAYVPTGTNAADTIDMVRAYQERRRQENSRFATRRSRRLARVPPS